MSKYDWEKLASKRAAQRALTAQHRPHSRRRKPRKASGRWKPRESTRLRCPRCQSLKVIVVRDRANNTRYRCDDCHDFVHDPIQVRILVTGKTFKVLT